MISPGAGGPFDCHHFVLRGLEQRPWNGLIELGRPARRPNPGGSAFIRPASHHASLRPESDQGIREVAAYRQDIRNVALTIR